jgi:hypothetical protein
LSQHAPDRGRHAMRYFQKAVLLTRFMDLFADRSRTYAHGLITYDYFQMKKLIDAGAMVDDAGQETGCWTKDGLPTNTISAGASSPSTARWDKDSIRTTRIIVVNKDGQERARWDTSSGGTSEFGLENGKGQAVIQMGCNPRERFRFWHQGRTRQYAY